MDVNKIMNAINSIKKNKTERSTGSFTATELSKELGFRCHVLLRELIETGEVEFIGKTTIKNICGGMQPVPLYRLCK